MDIRPASNVVPPTSALDGLQRVHSSSASDDSEDSQSAGYLFGDSHPGARHNNETLAESTSADADVVELSEEALVGHKPMQCTADEPLAPSLSTEPEDRSRIDLEA